MSRNSRSPTPRQLIEERVSKLAKRGDFMMESQKVYNYACLDTGMPFRTFGEAAQRSPFTGTKNFTEQTSADFQKLTDVPSNQKNPMAQTPLSANPVPSAPGAGPDSQAPWDTDLTWDDNPAPDASAAVGADTANPSGYVPYPGRPVPPHVNKNPGDRTDDAPAGSK